MSQSEPEQPSQRQENIVQGIQFGDGGGTFTFAPVQIGTQIETQIIQIATEKVTQRELIKASPYKGLKRFNFADRDRFFGRDALIKRLLKAVNQSSLSLVLGASGSGKSSVVRAGVIPELKQSLQAMKFYDFIFTPGKDPFESLHRCLLSEEKDYRFSESEIEIVREQRSETLSRAIKKLKKEDERWLFFIDQFEELFTNCGDPEIRQSFIDGIVQISEAKDSSVRIVLAMRSDFLEQFSSYPALGEILNQNNIHLVTDMHPDELRQAIEQPAAKHGVVFEEGLVEQIVKDVQGQSGYLPLLQYTLDLLWESECLELAADGRPNIEDRILNWSTYNALEGVRGALQKRVNQIYQNQDQDGQIATKQIFLRLVNIVDTESGSRAVSRRAYRSEFVGESIEKTLTIFINENLLVSGYEYLSEDDLLIGGVSSRRQYATVELAHEVLLSSWDALRRWLEEEKEAIILKNWLADETRRWQRIRAEDESRAKDELLKGARLAQVVAFRERNAFKKLGGLSPEENQFIDASVEWRDFQVRQAEERRQREIKQARRIAIGSIAAAVLMAGLAGLAGVQLRRAEIEQIRNSISLSESYLLSSEGLQSRIESIKAGELLQKSFWQRIWPTNNLHDQVLAQLQKTLFGVREISNLTGHQGSVSQLVLSSNGDYLASGSEDGKIRLWNQQGKLLVEWQGHEGVILAMEFNPDSTLLATSSEDGTARVWNLEGRRITELDIRQNSQGRQREVQTSWGEFQDLDPAIGPQGWVWDISFSPDGSKVATCNEEGKVQLWDLQGNQLAELKGHQGSIWEVIFGSNNIIATRGEDGIARLWNLEGILLAELKGHQGPIWDIAFDPVQSQFATSGEDGTIRIWNFQGNQLSILQGNQVPITSITYSKDGIIAARTQDGSVRAWDIQNNVSTEITGNKVGLAWNITFDPSGSQLAIIGEGGDIGVWKITKVISSRYDFNSQRDLISHELKSNILYQIRGNQSRVWSFTFNPDGNQLFTAGEDGIVRVWSTANSSTQLIGSRTQISPDGTKLITQDENDTLLFWDLQGNPITQISVLKDIASSLTLLFSPDGNHLAISSYSVNTTALFSFQNNQIIYLKGSLGYTTGWDLLGQKGPYSPDGTKLVTSDKGTVYLWNLQGEQLAALETGSELTSNIAFSLDSKKQLATIGDNTVRLWNFDGDKLAEFKNDQAHSEIGINDVVFSPDGNSLATNDGNNWVQIWDLEGNLKTSFNANHNGELSISFSPSGEQLITASFSAGAAGDRLARLWDLEGNKLAELIERQEGDFNQIMSLEFDPNKTTLVAHSDNGFIYLWNFQGELIDKISVPPIWGTGFKFSPDGRYLATFGGDSFVRVWQFFEGKPAKLLTELEGHIGQVTDMEFSPDMTQIVTSGEDNTIRFWNLQSKQLFQLDGSGNLNFSSDGHWIITQGYVDYGPFIQERYSYIHAWNIKDIDLLLSRSCREIANYLSSGSISDEEGTFCRN
jgi:WD40 repeat protein